MAEVGVWKGASSAIFTTELRRLGVGKVLAVDTWLGALEMWDRAAADTSRDLQLVSGYPSVYMTFLSNMAQLNLTNHVIPFPAPSELVAQFLRRHRVQIDLLSTLTPLTSTSQWRPTYLSASSLVYSSRSVPQPLTASGRKGIPAYNHALER